MTGRGPIALHGGGEFQTGDERVLAELLTLAWTRAERAGRGDPIRVAVVPTAGARGRPDLAAANGVAAFERVAGRAGRPIRAESVRIIDAASAEDPAMVAALRAADVIHFPGGDPDLIVSILPGTPAWAAVLDALEAGAVLTGASAGAMAFAQMTWTPAGIVPGLALVPGLAVAPHADASTWERVMARFGAGRPPGIGILGLAERTALIVEGDVWRVVGEGEVHWAAPGTGEVVVAGDGVTIRS